MTDFTLSVATAGPSVWFSRHPAATLERPHTPPGLYL